MTEIKTWDERWKPDGRTSPKRVMVEEIHDLRTENARLEAALKERGEPVAWRGWNDDSWVFTLWREEMPVQLEWQPLFTHPQPAREPMSDAQIEEAFGEKYRSDLALLRVARGNSDLALESIGARHRFAAFKTAIKAAEAFHHIKEKSE